MVYAISRESECNYNSDKSYEWYRYVYPEILENIYNNPHGKYGEWEEVYKSHPYWCYIVESPRKSRIMITRYPSRCKKYNRENREYSKYNTRSEYSETKKMYYRECKKKMYPCQESLYQYDENRHGKYIGRSVHEKIQSENELDYRKNPRIVKRFLDFQEYPL